LSNEFVFTRIGYVYVPTSNIDESIEWYTHNLGFQLQNKFQDRGSLMAVLHHPHKNSIACILIETADNMTLEISRNGHPFPIMAINCPDIEFTHAYMRANGIVIEELQTHGAGEAKYFYFRDNQGNLLEAVWSIWDSEDEIKVEFMN
jgi:catechol 2,3-dioxygenase-like lactoylglutathione lyase family enzyme